MFCNGFNDRSFEAWALEEDTIKQTHSGVASPITIDHDIKANLFQRQEDRDNCYLLVKNLPEGVSEKEVWDLFQDSISLEKVILLPKISSVYLKFTSTVEVQTIIAANEELPLVFKGQRLKMCSVMKLPLDLNRGSKVVLLTLYDEKIEVTAQTIYQIFREVSRPLRIIVFKKKNFQSFIEFETLEEAFDFKEKFDNANFKGFFFLKVQFTKKNALNVRKNTPFEFDFSLFNDSKPRFQTMDFNLLQNRRHAQRPLIPFHRL